MFQCTHTSASFINWRINGTPVNPINPPTFVTLTSSDGHLSDTLTILAQPEYNRTQIVCEATVSGSLQQSLPAILTVISKLGHT